MPSALLPDAHAVQQFCCVFNRRLIMADIIAIVTTAILFPLSLLYISACDHLKGSRR